MLCCIVGKSKGGGREKEEEAGHGISPVRQERETAVRRTGWCLGSGLRKRICGCSGTATDLLLCSKVCNKDRVAKTLCIVTWRTRREDNDDYARAVCGPTGTWHTHKTIDVIEISVG